MADTEFSDFVIETDLSNVTPWDGTPRPLQPVGDYVLQVVNVEHKAAVGSGAATIAVKFTVVEGPEGSDVGAAVYNNYSLSDAAKGRLAALVVACGGNLSQIRGGDLMNQTIRASIIHNEGKAKPDADGNPLPPKVFANVINELPFEEAPAAKAPAAKPPVQRQTAAAPATAPGTANGAAKAPATRRA